jgi:drug/metabolite transporter (DMT)-like permease
MIQLTGKQILAIVIAVLGVLMASTAQLNDLLGPTLTKTVVSIASLTNSVLASILAVLASQGNLVTDVQAMPGVEKIMVNKEANSTLAGLAVSPVNSKIEAVAADAAAISATAHGAV